MFSRCFNLLTIHAAPVILLETMGTKRLRVVGGVFGLSIIKKPIMSVISIAIIRITNLKQDSVIQQKRKKEIKILNK